MNPVREFELWKIFPFSIAITGEAIKFPQLNLFIRVIHFSVNFTLFVELIELISLMSWKVNIRKWTHYGGWSFVGKNKNYSAIIFFIS